MGVVMFMRKGIKVEVEATTEITNTPDAPETEEQTGSTPE